jgi:hypothetical protein
MKKQTVVRSWLLLAGILLSATAMAAGICGYVPNDCTTQQAWCSKIPGQTIILPNATSTASSVCTSRTISTTDICTNTAGGCPILNTATKLDISIVPVGTTSGTVAAGDDSRITGAVSSATCGTANALLKKDGACSAIYETAGVPTIAKTGAYDDTVAEFFQFTRPDYPSYYNAIVSGTGSGHNSLEFRLSNTSGTGRITALKLRDGVAYAYGTMVLGWPGIAGGSLQFNGSTSGTVTISPPATVTSYTLTPPAAAATAAGQVWASTGANATMGWVTPLTASSSITTAPPLVLSSTGTMTRTTTSTVTLTNTGTNTTTYTSTTTATSTTTGTSTDASIGSLADALGLGLAPDGILHLTSPLLAFPTAATQGVYLETDHQLRWKIYATTTRAPVGSGITSSLIVANAADERISFNGGSVFAGTNVYADGYVEGSNLTYDGHAALDLLASTAIGASGGDYAWAYRTGTDTTTDTTTGTSTSCPLNRNCTMVRTSTTTATATVTNTINGHAISGNPVLVTGDLADGLARPTGAPYYCGAGSALTSTSAGTTQCTSVVGPSRNVSTASGLQGGGNLSADLTLSPVYGTTANTVAQGNDSRIVNALPNTANRAVSEGSNYASTSNTYSVGNGNCVTVASVTVSSGANSSYALVTASTNPRPDAGGAAMCWARVEIDGSIPGWGRVRGKADDGLSEIPMAMNGFYSFGSTGDHTFVLKVCQLSGSTYNCLLNPGDTYYEHASISVVMYGY